MSFKGRKYKIAICPECRREVAVNSHVSNDKGRWPLRPHSKKVGQPCRVKTVAANKVYDPIEDS